MPKLSQLTENSVNALMSKLGFGAAKQSLLRWVEAGDGTDLSLAYDRAIAAGRRTLRLPEGEWDWSAPKNYVSGLKFIGDDEIKTSGVGGSKINAPNGFLKNDNTTRKQIVIKNLHVIGTNVASSVAIDGPFGGVVEGCKLEGFDDLIRNLSGYLVMYKRISFADALRGINTADANGTTIEQCHFNADVVTQVTTRDGTPQTGTNSGLPLTIRENNFNAADSTLFCLKVRGQLDIRANYFEKFNGGAVETRLIDLEVNRFDHQGAIIENNELNGQSSNATALYINGSHAGLDNPCEGRFTVNRVIGCNQGNAVVYGPNNRVPGFEVYSNFGVAVVNSYRVQHIHPEEEWTYAVLASDFTTGSATPVDVTSLGFTPAADAAYVVEGMLMCRTTTATVAAKPIFAWPTGISDGVHWFMMAATAGSSLPRYGNPVSNTGPAAADLPDTTGSWPCKLEAIVYAGASPSGQFRVQLSSETAATNVSIKAGSFIRYRRLL